MAHMPRLLIRLLPASLLSLAILLLAGCAEQRGVVSGKITVKGKPLPGGLITFLSEAGNRDAFSAQIVKGEYTTNPIPFGVAKITIVPSLNMTEKEAPKETGRGDRNPVPKASQATSEFSIPAKYHNADTSGLQITVKKGENTFDHDVKP